jgi:hypothetical protein
MQKSVWNRLSFPLGELGIIVLSAVPTKEPVDLDDTINMGHGKY